MNSVVIGGIVRMLILPDDIWRLIKEFLLYSSENYRDICSVRDFNLHRRVEYMLRRAYTPQDIADDTFVDVTDYHPLCRGFHMSSADLMSSVNCWTYENWNNTKCLEYKVEVEPYVPDNRYKMVQLSHDTAPNNQMIVTYQMGSGEILVHDESHVHKTYVEIISLFDDFKMHITNRQVTVTIGVGIGGKRLITPEMLAHIRDCKERELFNIFPAVIDYDSLGFVIPESTEYQDVSIAEFYKL